MCIQLHLEVQSEHKMERAKFGSIQAGERFWMIGYQISMCLAEVPVEHGLHYVTPGYQHGSMGLHVAIVQLERDIAKDAILNTIFL